MTAIRATFDGSRVILPPGIPAQAAGQVIVIFGDAAEGPADDTRALLSAAQESAFAKVWDNPEDAVYDQL